MTIQQSTGNRAIHIYSNRYNPNLNDPRVIKQMVKVIGFVLSNISPDSSRELSQKYLIKHFGQLQHPLSNFLRRVLLKCVDHHYSIEGHKAKSYILNEMGCEWCLQVITNKTKLKYSTWCKEYKDRVDNQLEEDFNYIKLYKAKDATIVEHFAAKYTESSLIIANHINQTFGVELASGNFNYRDKSHRRWHDLQFVQKPIKCKLLAQHGYIYNYDISTCAHSIILQLALQHGGDIADFEEFADYLKYKTIIREDLAELWGLSIKDVKVIFSAIACGAKLGIGDEYSLSKYYNHDYELLNKIKSNDWFSEFKPQLANAWRLIEKELTVSYKPVLDKEGNQVIDMTTGEIKMRKMPLNCRVKWDLYFRYERAILDIIEEYLISTGNKFFLEHDGWSSHNPVDLNELQLLIRERLGMNINFECDVYSIVNDELVITPYSDTVKADAFPSVTHIDEIAIAQSSIIVPVFSNLLSSKINNKALSLFYPLYITSFGVVNYPIHKRYNHRNRRRCDSS